MNTLIKSLFLSSMAAASGVTAMAAPQYEYTDTVAYTEIAIVPDVTFDPTELYSVVSDDGAVFDFSIEASGRYANLKSGRGGTSDTLIIPSSLYVGGREIPVEAIDDFAFMSRRDDDSPLRGVRNILIPEGIISIGQSAFQGAPDLVSVSIPSSASVIGYSCFEGARRLESVILAEEGDLFEIGSFAFAGCEALREFAIPQNVELIGEGPWRGCTSLREFGIADYNVLFDVIDGVLYSDNGATLLQYPAGKQDAEYRVEYGTRRIANSAFMGNTHIRSVTFPAALREISHLAFSGCTSLAGLNFNSILSSIGNKAFRGCSDLHKVTLYGSPLYTAESGDGLYNSFDPQTKVKVGVQLPKVKLSGDPLQSAWQHVAALKDFETVAIATPSEYGFPDSFGAGTMAFYGNAKPRVEVERYINEIPAKMLLIDVPTANGSDKVVRVYQNPKKPDAPLLFYKAGTGGNDTVLILFRHPESGAGRAWAESLRR